jgi:DNA-binding LacI/PurR family transcriptional regulator
VGGKGFTKLKTRAPRPTATVVSEFVISVGELNAARKAKLEVTSDVTITVFNDLEIAS